MEIPAVISKLDLNQLPARGSSLTESPVRTATSRRESNPTAADPDLRVTLSVESRRLADPDDSLEPGLSSEPADHPVASPPSPATRLDAYHELSRPVLGERVSIRV